MKVDVIKLKNLVDEKYLTVKKHPEAELFIWNYTHKCQFDKFWTPETLMCRGLITDLEGNVIQRPFKKFFNLAEHQGALPQEAFEVTEKYDGSLGILYWLGDKPQIATRGSFESEQAQKANEMLAGISSDVLNWLVECKHLTFLWEIIYPENRIVLNYGTEEKLVLLTIVHTDTGNEIDPHLVTTGVEIATRHKGIKALSELKVADDAEGYVITFHSGLKLKIKGDEYVRLHRLVTGINERRIWDMLRNDQSIDELLERVPDEFYDWVKKVVHDLGSSYHTIEQTATVAANDVAKEPKSRAEMAEVIKKTEYPSVAFAILSGKDYKQIIWRMIKPVANKPFKAVV